MSDTTTPAANVSAETSDPGAVDDYDGIVEQLGKEGFTPSTNQEDPAQQSEETEEETPEGIPAKDTLKVNGKTIEKPYSEIKEMAQKYQATEMKLETAKKEIIEARKMKDELSGQQEAVKNLLLVLQRGDLDTVAEFVSEHLNAGDVFNQSIVKYALKLYEDSKRSPQEREAIENKKLVAKMRAEAEARAKSDQDRAFEYQVNQWRQHIDVEVPRAITEVGLPNSDFVRESIISTWRAAIERGQNPTAAAVASFVKQRLDAAKLTGAPQQPKPIVQQRPTATKESVGKRGAASSAETGYSSWDAWIKNRGR